MSDIEQLSSAVLVEDTKKIARLIRAGVDVNGYVEQVDTRDTPLMCAAIHNRFEAAKLLIAAGADVNLASQFLESPEECAGSSPLIEAAQKGNLQMVKLLVEHGADLSYCCSGNDSALWIAVFSCQDQQGLEVVQYLLDCGCDPLLTPSGRNVLSAAALNSEARGVIAELIRRGADPNVLDSEFQATPLQAAIEYGGVRPVTELVEHGADPHLRWPKSDEDWSELTPLEYAKSLRKKQICAVLEQASQGAAASGRPAEAGEKRPAIPTVAASWKRLEAHLSSTFPDVGGSLNAGASQAQLDALERETGIRLSREAKDLFLRHNGQDDRHALIHLENEDEGFRLMTVEEVLSEWKMWKQLDEIGEFAGADGFPDDGVRNGWWCEKWLPFASNGAGDSLCFDFGPAKGGKRGQIITLWHERGDRAILFPTLRHLLADAVEFWLAEAAGA